MTEIEAIRLEKRVSDIEGKLRLLEQKIRVMVDTFPKIEILIRAWPLIIGGIKPNLHGVLIRKALHERRQAGLRVGRPPKLDAEDIRKVESLRAQTMSLRRIADEMNVSKSTVHKYTKGNAGLTV